MKKIIAILLLVLVACGIVYGGIFLFNTANVVAVEIVGDVQTIYFVNSTTNVDFNGAELKVTYKDGTVKMKKMTNRTVSVTHFSTSVVNNGLMKITYKSHSIDVPYNVVWTGLYYLESQKQYNYNGSSVTTTSQGPFIAGVNSSNTDKTTAKEMVYFYPNGSCDYYSRSSSTGTWYLDDGTFNNKFYYEIKGDTIYAHLGSKTYNLVAEVSNDGEMSLKSVENNYVSNVGMSSEFLKNKIERNFEHYEMKGKRTFRESNISAYSPSGAIKFKRGSNYELSGPTIYLIVNYTNDNFVKQVYVRFNKSMLRSEKEIDTSSVKSSATAIGFYQGVQFKINYSVYA